MKTKTKNEPEAKFPSEMTIKELKYWIKWGTTEVNEYIGFITTLEAELKSRKKK